MYDVTLAAACSALLGVAAALQKSGLARTTRFRDVWKSPHWVLGAFIELTADGLYVAAIMVEDARLVAVQPIVALHFLVAMAIGVGWMGERLARRELAAASLLVFGGGLVLSCLPPAGTRGAQLSPVALWLMAAFGAGATLTAFVPRRAAEPARDELRLACCAGLAFSVCVIATRVAGIDYWSQYDWPPTRAALGWLFGAAPLLAFAGNVAGFATAQLALKRGRVSVVAPVIGLVSLVVPLLVATLLLDEPMSGWAWLGTGAVGLGLATLATARARTPEPALETARS